MEQKARMRKEKKAMKEKKRKEKEDLLKKKGDRLMKNRPKILEWLKTEDMRQRKTHKGGRKGIG